MNVLQTHEKMLDIFRYGVVIQFTLWTGSISEVTIIIIYWKSMEREMNTLLLECKLVQLLTSMENFSKIKFFILSSTSDSKYFP